MLELVRASNIKFCILTMESFKFTVMAVLTDLCIYLRVVWLAAMNLRCLQRWKEPASLHSLGRQQDSSRSAKHRLKNRLDPSSPLPLMSPSSACCCGSPGAVLSFPEEKIYMVGCGFLLVRYLSGEPTVAIRTLERPFLRVRPHVDFKSASASKHLGR